MFYIFGLEVGDDYWVNHGETLDMGPILHCGKMSCGASRFVQTLSSGNHLKKTFLMGSGNEIIGNLRSLLERFLSLVV